MTHVSTTEVPGSSQRPYLIRALHEWCTDNGFTPYLAVHVDQHVQVPLEYVKNNEIVLNIGFEATSSLQMGNEAIEFKARFGGVSREIRVPVDHVVAIYARENGQGMAFPVPTAGGEAPTPAAASASSVAPAPAAPAASPRGLRLASSESAPDAPEATSSPADDEPPPPDPASPGSRPALKRIK